MLVIHLISQQLQLNNHTSEFFRFFPILRELHRTSKIEKQTCISATYGMIKMIFV